MLTASSRFWAHCPRSQTILPPCVTTAWARSLSRFCSGYVCLVLNLRMRLWAILVTIISCVKDSSRSAARIWHSRVFRTAGSLRHSREGSASSSAGCRFVIHDIVTLDGDLVREILGVVPDAPDETRSSPRLPGQPQKINPWLCRDAALMPGPALLVEGVHVEPAVVCCEAGRPDNGRNARAGEVEVKDGVLHAVRIWHGTTRLWLFRQVETISCDVSVGFVQHGEQIRVSLPEVFDQVRRKPHYAASAGLRAADQGNPLRRQEAKIDRVPAMYSAHCNRHVLLSGLPGSRIPLSKNAQPPTVVAPAIGPRRTLVRPHRKEDLASRFKKLFGDLGSGGA